MDTTKNDSTTTKGTGTGDTVTVTGGTGFLASHAIAQLLERGYRVRATVRSLAREGEIRKALRRAGVEAGSRLEVVEADLSDDAGWPAAVAGARFVLHIASPFPATVPENDDEVIRPARDGALRVVRAARDAGVERVVMTSSFAAVGYGHPPTDREFTERDWTDVDSPLSAYIRSKAVAERGVWDFIADEGGDLELAVVNPVGIFGPPLGSDLSSSVQLARQMLTGMRGVPKLATTVVDVRDAADLHLRAMTDPAAAGQRFLASTGEPLPFRDVARILREAVGREGRAARSGALPNWLVRLAARRNPGLQGMVPELGKVRRVSSAKARDLLGWRPRGNEETLAATARALRDLGLLDHGVSRVGS